MNLNEARHYRITNGNHRLADDVFDAIGYEHTIAFAFTIASTMLITPKGKLWIPSYSSTGNSLAFFLEWEQEDRYVIWDVSSY